MSIGLSVGPAIWQSYINGVLGSIPGRSKYLGIMGILLLHSSKLLRTELQCMGNTILIKDKGVGIKPLKTRLEAIQKYI